MQNILKYKVHFNWIYLTYRTREQTMQSAERMPMAESLNFNHLLSIAVPMKVPQSAAMPEMVRKILKSLPFQFSFFSVKRYQ